MRKTTSAISLLNVLVFVCVALLLSAQTARAITILPQPASPVTLTTFISGVDFNNPIGIDFDEPTAKLIASVHFPTGLPHNLELIDVGTATASQFSSLAGLTEELKIATVRNSACQVASGFAIGEVFTGNGIPGQIVRISADGTVVQNPWVTLPGETKLLRGSLYVDRSCVFGGDLIVVTGNSGPTGTGADEGGGNVWRMKANGTATLLASITDPVTGLPVHLEGVITLPNDPRYGPWAGTIIAGDENFNSDLTKKGRIWSITGGVATPYELAFTAGGVFHPVKPEDLDLIDPGADFFGVNFSDSRILKANAT